MDSLLSLSLLVFLEGEREGEREGHRPPPIARCILLMLPLDICASARSARREKERMMVGIRYMMTLVMKKLSCLRRRRC